MTEGSGSDCSVAGAKPVRLGADGVQPKSEALNLPISIINTNICFQSTTTIPQKALLNFTNAVYTSSEYSKLTGVIFLDLTKPFDIVDHYLLFDELYWCLSK